jgi:hypothetical protein
MDTITLTRHEADHVVAALATLHAILGKNYETGHPNAEEDRKWVAGILQNFNEKLGNTTVSWLNIE